MSDVSNQPFNDVRAISHVFFLLPGLMGGIRYRWKSTGGGLL